MKKLIFLSVVLFSLNCSSEQHKHHWGYQGESAPDKWYTLEPNFATCKIGNEQSPIDIVDAKDAKASLTISYGESPVKIINNGHTIQLNYVGKGFIVSNGNTYKLVQMHWHSDSEHSIGGKKFPLEVHLLHKSDDGKLAIIGILFKEGAENTFLKKVWTELPATESPEIEVKANYNPNELFPKQRAYFQYSGSLTTPPCLEGVEWYVIKEPMTASKEQIAQFKAIFSNNARPVQPINARELKLLK